ncbi:MAG: efflux transporter periplasmic adaptor subunit [Curvibacter sp. RIFCSPHIGHO2_12_FULL_63_18]|uniref:efflux RND transporter periplasmic adaptor subunit n=1 Tax=Rhodoferax sp. TaxID=50421 RepID=UPI0008C700DC|nr:efflux RND transporter periplasmic adaptor subunit [Rhodoferax sp.]OGO94973.1 MAG: efflux transporter periplasmic adaptor subunit [Curvibacter sp. GWA2_63_95]OGP05167.1 MAG: efflux transporter periplasmic adaptor subunit [Curvibacter sp. RIFCSPHIGHO2_12_FULL_63_18]HCX82302.1 efflux RND transporter periplasmic adaptor subunit [Rhodoferax sp.]
MTKNHQRLSIAAACIVALGLAVVLFKPAGTAATPATTASALTVELTTPQSSEWPQELRASGAVAPWEEIVVSPETGGLRVDALLVSVGDRVVRGQLLARLADATVRAELAKQQALVAQAQASLQQAAGNLKRAQGVDVAGALAPQKLDEYQANEATARASLASAQADLQSANLKLSQTQVTAPDAGVVSSRSGVVGNVASVGTELMRLIRQGRIEWRAELDARQLTQVRAGQTAQVQLPGSQLVAGKVRLVSPTLSTTTGRGIAYVSLDAASARSDVRAGVFAEGTIALQQQTALTLPESALVMRDGRSYVYTVGADNKVSSQPVTSGRRQGARVEVVSGLDAATRVVAKGGAFLSDGMQVTVVSGPSATVGVGQ